MKIKCALMICLLSTVSFAGDYQRQLIEKRIKPIGQVNEGQSSVSEAVVVKPEAVVAKKEPGQATYEQYCAVCHTSGVAGAPKYQDQIGWKARTKVKDLTQLTQSAIKGINAMPAKGTCMQCSDKEIEQAIAYMLPK